MKNENALDRESLLQYPAKFNGGAHKKALEYSKAALNYVEPDEIRRIGNETNPNRFGHG